MKKEDIKTPHKSYSVKTGNKAGCKFERLLEQRNRELDGLLTCQNLMLMENLLWQGEKFCHDELIIEPDGLFYYKETEDGESKALPVDDIKLFAVEYIEYRKYRTICMIFKNARKEEFYSLYRSVSDDFINQRVYEGWKELFAYTIDGDVSDYLNKEHTKYYNQRWFKLQELLNDDQIQGDDEAVGIDSEDFFDSVRSELPIE